MDLILLKSKIHTVKVTQANINYKGSITIDEDLMDRANIKTWEQVHVNNASKSSRIITYAIPGERGSGIIGMNGGAALHADEGDTIHILSFCNVPEKDYDSHQPIIIQTKGNNEYAGFGQH